jgi:hypothetical protein
MYSTESAVLLYQFALKPKIQMDSSAHKLLG